MIVGSTSRPRERSAPLWSIQYLRAVAALMVVVHHLIHPGKPTLLMLNDVNVGARGVDVFFVISGFIMYVAARDESFLQFWKRRLIRIVPLYWLATALMAVVKLHYRGFIASGTVLLTSVLFIPHYSEDNPSFVWPFLVPGWTLNYEMFFYLIFSIGILSRHVVISVSMLIIGFVIAGITLSSSSAAFQVYTDPLMLEFLGGLLLGWIHERIRFARVHILLWLGFIGLFVADVSLQGSRSIVAMSALAVVAGAIGYEDRGPVPRWPFGKLLGDASYSIYLVHPSVIWIVAATIERMVQGTTTTVIAEIGLGLISSVGAGLLVHKGIERPMLIAIGRISSFRRAAVRTLG